MLSGCASSGVGSVAQTTRAEYYPSCYEPVSHLRSTDNAVRNSAITGAITGGLLGGLAGGLASDENRGRNAALAAAGGAPGGAAGYYMEKQKQISDDRARIGSYATDVDRSTVEINRSVAYAKSAQSCYQSQFKALLDGRKNKSINEAEGASAWPRSSAACRRPTPCWSPPTAVPARTSTTTPRPTRKTCSRSAYRAPK